MGPVMSYFLYDYYYHYSSSCSDYIQPLFYELLELRSTAGRRGWSPCRRFTLDGVMTVKL